MYGIAIVHDVVYMFVVSGPGGKYCTSPTKSADLPSRLCNAGRYSTGGATSSTCPGVCTAGYVCAAGSSSASPAECGGSGERYCPSGSSSYATVSTGYYTTGGTVTTRTSQAICPIGTFRVALSATVINNVPL